MGIKLFDEHGNPNPKAFIKILVIVFIVLFSVFPILGSIKVVDAGTIQVVKRWGRVTGQRLDPGMHIIIPFAESTEALNTRKLIYETTSEEKQAGSGADYKDYPVDTNTADGQQVDIFYTVRFSIDVTKATWVIQNIGSEIALVEKIVKTESRVWVRNTPREFEANQLYTGNVVEVQNRIEDRLRPVFEANGLVLDSVGIREIKFMPDYIQAIENKQIEAVKVETAENISRQAEFEKQTRITQAEGLAKEQELQRQTLSSELLEKMWIERWDGKLPTYMMGDSQALIQLPR